MNENKRIKQEEVFSPYVLNRIVFEYYLETITNRNETQKFEIFCRKLCEQAIYPNLRAHTGPDGGGDSKVDTETYPVSDKIADNFYIGEGAAVNGRWAFAFSAQENWKKKVKEDVKKITETGRDYKQIVFVTSRFAKDSTRSQIEDSLSKEYGIPVIIHDRSWIVQETIDKGRKDLAFEHLGVGEKTTSPHGLAPTVLVNQKIEKEVDTLRKIRFFNEVNRIDNTLLLGGQLVEGELSSGAHDVQSYALAWCARLLARSEKVETAKEYLQRAKQLGACPEINVAEAFIVSQAGDKKTALGILAKIDTPLSRSAALMVVAHHEGAEGAINWLKKARINSDELDSDGKFFLLNLQLEFAQWEVAMEASGRLSNSDLDNTPALHHTVAITYLLKAVPAEFRPLVIRQLPLDSARFPLASDTSSMDARDRALRLFRDAANIERQLNCPRIASLDDEYALWLELMNPETVKTGRERLEGKLRDSKSALQWISLGLNFGINLNLSTVEQQIEENIALHGGITRETATARFALALSQKSPKDVANYVQHHYDDMVKFLGNERIDALQIEAFTYAGEPDKAKQILSKSKISEEDKARLRTMIAAETSADPVELLKEQFKQSDTLNNLIALVNGLQKQQSWSELRKFGNELFQRTRSVDDAELVAMALGNTQDSDNLVEFLKDLHDLRKQSKNLQMSYCWALYDEGEFLESRLEMLKLNDESDDPNYRQLNVNLGIALGDWASLSAYVANEYQAQDNRDAHDLMQTAYLAHHLGSPQAKNLTCTAVAKDEDNPEILAAAHNLAATFGWENDKEAVQWIQKAIKTSRDDGPIQTMTLKDFADRKPEWDDRQSKTWQKLGQGDMPMFFAGETVNRTLVSLMLFSAYANLSEHDPRRRGAVPAYSGKRSSLPLDVATKTVGMDASVLLTLGFLDLLDDALDAFETVYVPHSTTVWLFEEKQKAAFHQPSQIEDASRMHDMLAEDTLTKFVSSTVENSDLSAQVGGNLAMLIAEAEKIRDNDKTQHIVVCPRPVYRVGSLMGEEADLIKHAKVMSSCLAIVERLKQKGDIDADEENKARDYLQPREEPWPQQPNISNGAVLYLDDLAINYFLDLGILDKLKTAGFTAIASPREVSESNALISYKSNADKVIKIIEHIQDALNSRIESKQIKFSRRYKPEQLKEKPIENHPSIGTLALAEVCDAVIIDDRYFNQHTNINEAGMTATIFSTLDLIDGLTKADIITSNQSMKYRTRLRRAGYFFVPVRDDELVQHLNACLNTDGKFRETSELRAIRQNLLRARMSDWLQLPKEAPWLHETARVLVTTLKEFWKSGANPSKIEAISDWIVDQINICGWAHRLDTETAENIIKTGQGNHVFLLLTPPLDISKDTRKAYWKWMESRVLAPIKEQFSEIYNWIVDLHKQQLADLVDKGLDQEGTVSDPHLRPILAQAALEHLPPLILEALLNQPDFCEEYGFEADATIMFGNTGISIRRSKLFKVVRDVFAGQSEVIATDINGHDLKISVSREERKHPQILISNDDQKHILPDYLVALSPNSATRLRWFEETAADLNLPVNATTTWRNILSERILEDGEVDLLHRELRDTPIDMARSIRVEIQKDQINIPSLVPPSRRYFARLVGEYDGSSSVGDYATGAGKSFMEELLARRPYDGFLSSLLLSSNSALTAEISVKHLDVENIIQAFEFLVERGDKLSQLGAVEVGLRILPEMPEIESLLVRLVERIRDDNVDKAVSEFKLFSTLFILVDGELSRTRLFSDAPPFFRRLASLAQAALIQREIMTVSIDINSFCERAWKLRGEQFCFQSLADMRLEPRWNPDFANSLQMKSDFFGRLTIAGENHKETISNGKLRNLLLSPDSGSLLSLINSPRLYFPGPLEGEKINSRMLPDELMETIETQLKTEKVGPSSFIALVNSALIFYVDKDQAKMAAEALRTSNYQLANIEDRFQLLATLYGLATAAAVSRERILADELRVLVRRYRKDPQYALSIDETLRICLVASASRRDPKDWQENVGDWLTELAFENFQDTEGQVLYSHLLCLLRAVPELWISCGKADAALKASLKR